MKVHLLYIFSPLLSPLVSVKVSFLFCLFSHSLVSGVTTVHFHDDWLLWALLKMLIAVCKWPFHIWCLFKKDGFYFSYWSVGVLYVCCKKNSHGLLFYSQWCLLMKITFNFNSFITSLWLWIYYSLLTSRNIVYL